MRLPNGYGSVVHLSGKRRRPFWVRKTTGWTDKAYPIYATIGYYETRQLGLSALVKYNDNPYNLTDAEMTFKDLYEKYIAERGEKLGSWLKSCLSTAYNRCGPLQATPYHSLRTYQMQNAINASGGYASQKQTKNLFYHTDRFAFEMDLIEKQYSTITTIDQAPETSRRPFTNEEIATLWLHVADPWVDSVLFFMYTGWRINEMLAIRKTDISLEEQTITGGSKSEAGKNRIIPIHPKIKEIVEKRYSESKNYLFENDNNKLSSSAYYDRWSVIMTSLAMNHVVHECRHTLRSAMDSAGANKVCIDMIMGHKSQGVGERVYTHKTIQDLRESLQLVTY